ncbi:MAG: RNA-binding domain-containing protein [bacterium]
MDLRKLVLQGESETLEFKKSAGEWKEIIKTIAAFGSTRVGKIVIDISDSDKMSGVKIGSQDSGSFESQFVKKRRILC